jgi:hypothetical protein
MRWTVNWFEHHRKEWIQRSQKSQQMQLPGHTAYAEKQVAMWQQFVDAGNKAFAGVMVDERVEEAISGNDEDDEDSDDGGESD